MKIYSDGGSRGNPGPAAYAYIIIKNNEIIHKNAEKLGITTNNVAEYNGLINGLKKAKNIDADKLTCYSDSELMIKQLNNVYRIRSERLKPLYEKVRRLSNFFEKISFVHVPRTNHYIKIVDGLLNKELDE